MNHSIKQSIKAWPQQERPRERLLEQGASSLSDAELLAIFLRSGSRQHSAVELAPGEAQITVGIYDIFFIGGGEGPMFKPVTKGSCA